MMMPRPFTFVFRKRRVPFLTARRKLAHGFLASLVIGAGLCLSAPSKTTSGNATLHAKTKAGKYITCLARDSSGRLWIGSEDQGIACLDGQNLTIFKDKQAVASQYPLSITPASNGSVFIGTSNNGLLRFENGTWSRIGILEGLCGTRANCILQMEDNTIWVALETGIFQYLNNNSQYRLHTTDDNIPDGEIVSLASDADGRIWAANASKQLSVFENGKWYLLPQEDCPWAGSINQILVGRDGTFWLATTEGLFSSSESAPEWQYHRPGKLIPSCMEDYVTCIAQNTDGSILFGLRKAGFLRFYPKTNQWKLFSPQSSALPDSFVSAFLPMPDNRLLVGTYGGGVCILDDTGGPCASFEELYVSESAFAPTLLHESYHAPDTVLNNRYKHDSNTPNADVVYIGEDWQTQGEWIGKYGSFAYILAAMGIPNDYIGGDFAHEVSYAPRMGAKRKANDSLRYWTHRKSSQDPRSLQCPTSSCRRQSSWDDAGENYPPSLNGPDVFFDLELPHGTFLVSLYFVNIDILDAPSSWKTFDGFPSPNRFRDFDIEVEYATSSQPHDLSPPLATARVQRFGSGVYKRFQVNGGKRYTFRIARNQSHNTLLSAIFVDKISDLLKHTLLDTILPDSTMATASETENDLFEEATSLHQQLTCLKERLVFCSDDFFQSPFSSLPQKILPLAAYGSQILMRCKDDRQVFAMAVRNQFTMATLLQVAGYPHAASRIYAQIGQTFAGQFLSKDGFSLDSEIHDMFRSYSSQIWNKRYRPCFEHFKPFEWDPMSVEGRFVSQFVSNAPLHSRDLLVDMAQTAGRDIKTMALSLLLWEELEKRQINLEMDSEAFDKARTLFFSGHYRKAAETFAACASSQDSSKDLKIHALAWQYHVATSVLKDKSMASAVLSKLKKMDATEQAAVEINGLDRPKKP